MESITVELKSKAEQHTEEMVLDPVQPNIKSQELQSK